MDEQNTPAELQPAPVELAVVRFVEVPNVELHVPVGCKPQEVMRLIASIAWVYGTAGWNEAEQFKAMSEDLKAEREGMEQAEYDNRWAPVNDCAPEPDPSHD